MRIEVLGKRWGLRFAPNMAAGGDIDPPAKLGKEIRIWSGLNGEDRLRVIIHELIHAAGWHVTEEYADDFAADVARVLTRLGYVHDP